MPGQLVPLGAIFTQTVNCDFTLHGPEIPLGPLIIESPHHNEILPRGATNYCPEEPESSHMVDKYMGILIEPLAKMFPTLFSNKTRLYIDLNRAETCLNPNCIEGDIVDLKINRKDPYASSYIWLIPTIPSSLHGPLLKKPTAATIKERLLFWHSYHNVLGHIITSQNTRFGESVHLSMHSFPGQKMREARKLKGCDVILSTSYGETASPEIVENLKACFESKGYHVLVDDVFTGGALIKKHGHPNAQRHSVQIEIERNLYMNTDTLELKVDEFGVLQTNLTQIIKHFNELVLEQLHMKKLSQTPDASPGQDDLAAE